ncbi:MAG TPA: TIGR00730 family Rossman fold protein [Solirubrobacteraceae bacterium]|nr:TIGR00730 family Rossman fold protein [Solirubrobacteraceae bacterium]
MINRILIFCGSSPGLRPEYAEAAVALGRLLAERGAGVVYGGASVGLMGAVADGALAAGGEVIGVIPTRLVESEIAHAGLTDLRVVETMHERKALMAELSDAVIALPGGTGTLDELFEMITWAQLGLHRKPIGLLDVLGYWERLLAFLDHMVDERFLYAEHRDMLIVEHAAAALVERLGSFEHRARDKWVDRSGADQVPNTRSPASPSPGRM